MTHSDDPYNKFGFFCFIFSMAGSILFFVYISFIHGGVTGIDKVIEPDSAEAQALAKKAINPDEVEKPWVVTEDMALAGKKVYKMNCAVCHGPKGLGMDNAALAGLKARNLVAGDWKQGGTSEALFKTLQNGVAGTTMVSFKHLSKNSRWALVQYIRSITENKTEDDAAALEAFAQTAD